MLCCGEADRAAPKILSDAMEESAAAVDSVKQQGS